MYFGWHYCCSAAQQKLLLPMTNAKSTYSLNWWQAWWLFNRKRNNRRMHNRQMYFGFPAALNEYTNAVYGCIFMTSLSFKFPFIELTGSPPSEESTLMQAAHYMRACSRTNKPVQYQRGHIYKYLIIPRPSTLSFVAWSCFFFGALNCCNFLFICSGQFTKVKLVTSILTKITRYIIYIKKKKSLKFLISSLSRYTSSYLTLLLLLLFTNLLLLSTD